MKNNNVKAAVDIVLYLIVFVLLQVIFLNGADLMGKHYGIDSAITMAAGTALSGLITIVIFLWRRWSPYSREYIATRPWTALVWVVLLSLGTIIPSQWMIEVLDVDMPKETLELMTKLLGTPWGYLAVGVCYYHLSLALWGFACQWTTVCPCCAYRSASWLDV